MKFVLDASLSLAWCFEDERTEFTEAVLQALPAVGAAVPSLWIYEVGNGLRSAQRQKRLTEAAAVEFAARLEQLPIAPVVLEVGRVLGDARLLGLRLGLTVYDASYLVLAQHLHLPLATLDGTGKRSGLKQAADASEVELLTPERLAAWPA